MAQLDLAIPLSNPAASTSGGDSFRIWEKDRQCAFNSCAKRVEQDIVEGKPFEAFLTERGRFDAMFDFMLRNGLWTFPSKARVIFSSNDGNYWKSLPYLCKYFWQTNFLDVGSEPYCRCKSRLLLSGPARHCRRTRRID